MVAGAAGVAVMTVGEKPEQRLTGRPDSHVPGRVLERLLGRPGAPREQPRSAVLAMQVGQAVLVGAPRGVMADVGLRGPPTPAADRGGPGRRVTASRRRYSF